MSGQAVLLGLLALAAAARCLAIEEVPAEETLEARPLGGLLQSFTNDPVCKNRETTCSADCRGLFHCSNMGNGIWVPLNPSMSKCPAAKPYCTSEGDEAFCTATPPPSTGGTCTPSSEPLPTGTYNCAADGYWPDLTSCTRYYLCVGNNAYRFDCSAFPGTVYDQRTTRCVPKGRGTCATLSCNHFRLDKPVEYHVYTPAPWIFAVCNSRDASTALVSACPSQRQTKDQTTGECVERCDQEGRFLPLGGADGGTNFVDCVSLGGSKLSAPTPGVCPTGTTFSAALGRCTV